MWFCSFIYCPDWIILTLVSWSLILINVLRNFNILFGVAAIYSKNRYIITFRIFSKYLWYLRCYLSKLTFLGHVIKTIWKFGKNKMLQFIQHDLIKRITCMTYSPYVYFDIQRNGAWSKDHLKMITVVWPCLSLQYRLVFKSSRL